MARPRCFLFIYFSLLFLSFFFSTHLLEAISLAVSDSHAFRTFFSYRGICDLADFIMLFFISCHISSGSLATKLIALNMFIILKLYALEMF